MTYGLPPRPELSSEELAAVIAAAEQILKSDKARVVDATPSWRFSGRWFNSGRYTLRRPYRPS